MTHKDVHEMFTRLFPMYSAGEYTWYPSGRNTIRIKIIENIYRGLERIEFIFTYHTNKCWSFETLTMYNKYRIKE